MQAADEVDDPDPTGTEPILFRLSLASTTVHPEDLAAVVAREADRDGFGEFTIYLADLEQLILTPLRSPGLPPVDSLPIDGSDAGRAYRTEEPVIPSADDGKDDRLIWLPLLDSAERLGVVSTRIGAVSEATITDCHALANVVGELVANKQSYGDLITLTRRTREMTLAAEMRWSMLPPLTFKGRNLAISGILEPAYEIAGDTFDYAINGNTAHVAVVDAVGHGLEAARIANLAVGSYRHARRRNLGLLETYREMDRAVASQFGPEKFAATMLVTLELASGRLRGINAGIPPALIIRRGQCVDALTDASLPTGLGSLAPAADPEVTETILEPGDMLLLATDGIIEARSAQGEDFGRERLVEMATAAAALRQTPAETLRLIAHAVLAHQHGVLQDDATLVLVAWNGPPDQSSDPPSTADRPTAGTSRDRGQ